jgi:hypothetical protein
VNTDTHVNQSSNRTASHHLEPPLEQRLEVRLAQDPQVRAQRQHLRGRVLSNGFCRMKCGDIGKEGVMRMDGSGRLEHAKRCGHGKPEVHHCGVMLRSALVNTLRRETRLASAVQTSAHTDSTT